MPKSIMVRPFRRLTQAELDGFLEKAADILRGSVDHSEFRGYVFAFLFFKRISDVFAEEVRNLTEQLGDDILAQDPRMHNFVVPEGSVWDEVARQSRNQLGPALNGWTGACDQALASHAAGQYRLCREAGLAVGPDVWHATLCNSDGKEGIDGSGRDSARAHLLWG